MYRQRLTLTGMAIWSLTAISLHAQPPTNKQPSAPNVNVPKYVEQLGKLSDVEVQSAADELVNKLLGEFRHGAAIEQSRNRRAAYQRYRTTLKADIAQCDAEYQALTKWLLSQKKQIESQATASQGSDELARQRFEAIVERQSQRALAIETRRESLQRQIAQIDERINNELTHEAFTSDQLASEASAARPEKVISLPDAFESLGETNLSLPLPLSPSSKSLRQSSKVPVGNDSERSASDKIDPKQAAAAKRLLEALQQQEKTK